MNKLRLHVLIAAVCPIDGVGGQQGSVRVDYRPEATTEQRASAQAVVDAFDWSLAAQTEWEENQQPERKALRLAAAQAIADNLVYLAITTPTAAQVRQQTDALTRQVTHLIRRLIQID